MNKYSAVQWSPGGTTVNKGPTCTDRGPKCAGTVPPPQDFHFYHCTSLCFICLSSEKLLFSSDKTIRSSIIILVNKSLHNWWHHLPWLLQLSSNHPSCKCNVVCSKP